MTFALHSKVAHACLFFFTPPPKSPVQMTNSLLLSINTIYLSIPAGGLTSNVSCVCVCVGGGGCGGWKRVKKEREGESGVGRAGGAGKESAEQAEEERLGANGP